MKKTIKDKIKNLVSELETFVFDGKKIYKIPVGDVLSGFYIEKSGHNYYVWLYFQPLIVDSTNVTFTFSHRLKDPAGRSQFFLDNFEDRDWEDFLSILKDKINLINLLQDTKTFYNYFNKIEASFNIKVGLAFIAAYLYLDDADTKLKSILLSLDLEIEWQRELNNKIEKILSVPTDERHEIFMDWKLKNFDRFNLR